MNITDQNIISEFLDQIVEEITETGIDVSNIMEFIADTTKSSLYFESLVPQEMRGMFKSLSALRSVASSVALSWHFANLPREVLMGF